jgi:hypothetical protein
MDPLGPILIDSFSPQAIYFGSFGATVRVPAPSNLKFELVDLLQFRHNGSRLIAEAHDAFIGAPSQHISEPI